MGEIKNQLRTDLTAAMKARDEFAKSTIRMALGAIQYAEVAGDEARELTKDEEIAVLKQVSAAVPQVSWGLVINWARSAIEGRSAQTPLEHIKTAAASGWLRHVGFSSCADSENAWGGPWADQHVPLAGTAAAPEGSLLGAAEVAAAIAAAGDVSYGLKIALRPKDMPGEQKLAALDENAALIIANA